MPSQIFLWKEKEGRIAIQSLAPHLHRSLQGEATRMLPHLMRNEDVAICRWTGYGIGKGITNPVTHISVFGIPDKVNSGLHGELVKGFPDVDPPPLCYETTHEKGFGDFVRWVYFADPEKKKDFFGIDFSLALRPTSGVATSFLTVHKVVETAVMHGIPEDTETVLLNWRMIEDEYMTRTRLAAGLITAQDWMDKRRQNFLPDSMFCPRCGQKTLDAVTSNFCHQCGCKPKDFYLTLT